jgi:hypothetical protein
MGRLGDGEMGRWGDAFSKSRRRGGAEKEVKRRSNSIKLLTKILT